MAACHAMKKLNTKGTQGSAAVQFTLQWGSPLHTFSNFFYLLLEFLCFQNGYLNKSVCDLQEQTIDMVLTDYCMPEMTGYDLLKAIKVNHPHKTTSFLLLACVVSFNLRIPCLALRHAAIFTVVFRR